MAKAKISSLSSSKKIPKQSSSKAVAVQLKADQVAELEKRISANPEDLNPLADLLKILKASLDVKPKLVHSAIHALHRIFSSLVQQGRLHGKLKGGSEASVKVVREWLKERYNAYTGHLVQLLHSQDQTLAMAALNLLMDLLRTESERMTTLQSPPAYQLATALWSKIVAGLLSVDLETQLRTHFLDKYINYYDDIRYHFLREAPAACAASSDKDITAETLLSIMEGISSMPSQADHINRFWAAPIESVKKPEASGSRPNKKRKTNGDGSTGIFDSSSEDDEEQLNHSKASTTSKLPDLLSVQGHRRAFQSSWMAVLPLLTSEEQLKRVLAILHQNIMPHLPNPAILLDFLVDCCSHGGTIALLALNGLFTLMMKHNLDYPSFYRQLYKLLDHNVLHVRYRSRFFRMMELFLSSSHLPVAMIASFIKRLSRLSLSAPPAAIVSIIPFVYNLLKRHPQCTILIHRPLDDEERPNAFEDPFEAEEEDPLKTNAIDSSIWELTSMRSHYLGSVATLAKIFQEQLTKPNYNLDDFLDHAYASLFETELKRKIVHAPALDLPPLIAKQAAFFPLASDASSDGKDAVWSDAVTELFVF